MSDPAVVTHARLAPYQGGGLGGRAGFGRRPVLLVVDLCAGFTDPGYPPGTDLDQVVANVRLLADCARAQRVPVVFTTIAFAPDGSEGRAWRRKMPAIEALAEGSPAVEIDPRLGRRPGEPVVVKRAASAFSFTGLPAILAGLTADCLVVCGATTSGCVRATVVDACMAGYPTVVPADCVGDRHAGAHAANLFDIDAKYGDVLDLPQTISLLSGPAGAAT